MGEGKFWYGVIVGGFGLWEFCEFGEYYGGRRERYLFLRLVNVFSGEDDSYSRINMIFLEYLI